MVAAMSRTPVIPALAVAVLLVAPPAARAATVVVKPSPGARPRLRAAGAEQTVGRVARLGLRVVRVSGDPAAAAARLSRSRGVSWAEPTRRGPRPAPLPADPLSRPPPPGPRGPPPA